MGDIFWVDPGWFAPVPATLISATVGDYIAIGPPDEPPDEPPDGLVDGVRMSDREVIEAFEAWMRAWKGQTLASVAEESEQGAQREGYEADERSTPNRQSRKSTASRWGFAVMVAVVLFLAYDAFKIFLPYEITRREPIGHLVSAHTSDSGAYPWVLETDQGVYPLAKALMVDKGAPLTLLGLSNGRHLVCDQTLQVCARTVGEDRRIKRKVDGQGER